MTPLSLLPIRPDAAPSAPPRGFTLVREGRWPSRSLAGLLESCHIAVPTGLSELEISGVSSDPLGVGPGSLFLAPCVARARLADMMVQARDRGAVAAITGTRMSLEGIFDVPTDDLRAAHALISARFHGAPSRQLDVCGISGFAGKTTVAILLRAILEAAGRAPGLLSSLIHETGAAVYRPFNTTPSVDRVHAVLREMVDARRKSAVIEVSDRALVEGRVDGVWLRTGLFLGLDPDGGDDERTLAHDLDVQAELVRSIPSDGVAVLSADDAASEVLRDETSAEVLTFGVEHSADVQGRILRLDLTGSEIELRTASGRIRLRSGLQGRHHVTNVVAAAAAALSMGVDLDAIARGVATVRRVPGRLETLAVPAPYSVHLDAADSRSRLDQVLGDLRPLVAGRLWLVLGGDVRIPSHRRGSLAAVAERWADTIVLTTADAGVENPMTSIKELVHGLKEPRRARLEPDRGRALALALGEAGAGDAILVVRRRQGEGEPLGRSGPDREMIDAWFRT